MFYTIVIFSDSGATTVRVLVPQRQDHQLRHKTDKSLLRSRWGQSYQSNSNNRVGILRRKHKEDEQPFGDCLGAEVWQRQLHLQVNIENYLNPIKPCTFWSPGEIGSIIHLNNAKRNCIDNYILIIHRENFIKDVCFQHHPCRAKYHLCICQPRWVCICVCICICICTYL